MSTLTILHFNDVYNIGEQKEEPKGGAARMKSYITSQESCNPLVLFSGDALNPSLLSIFLKGEQMIPVLNELNVKAAVYGNHDFDFGVDHLEAFSIRSTFPWLLSNVADTVNNAPLANGELYVMIEHAGIKIGIMGLVEEEWIETLSTVDPKDLIFTDFVECGTKLCHTLRGKGADLIVALTHMRLPNDTRLAQEVEDIDIVLAGHDHDYEIVKVKDTYVVKSGTDFRNMSKITLTHSEGDTGWSVDIEKVDLDSSIEPDVGMCKIVHEHLGSVDSKMDVVLGYMNVDMDGKFSSVRTRETNLGNFISDIILTATNADVSILNSGTLRSDRIHLKGEFKLRDLLTILPLVDPLVVMACTGAQLHLALENGVSKYPVKEGRFPQVAGVSFGFNPSMPPGHRVPLQLVMVQGEYLDLDKTYRVATKEYLSLGKDGYDVFKECPIVGDAEMCPALSTMVRNHFEAVEIHLGKKECKSGHRQCLVSLKARDDITTLCEVQDHSPLVRQRSIHELEEETTHLSPKVDGRILLLTDEKTSVMRALKDGDLHRNLSDVREESSSSMASLSRSCDDNDGDDDGSKHDMMVQSFSSKAFHNRSFDDDDGDDELQHDGKGQSFSSMAFLSGSRDDDGDDDDNDEVENDGKVQSFSSMAFLTGSRDDDDGDDDLKNDGEVQSFSSMAFLTPSRDDDDGDDNDDLENDGEVQSFSSMAFLSGSRDDDDGDDDNDEIGNDGKVQSFSSMAFLTGSRDDDTGDE